MENKFKVGDCLYDVSKHCIIRYRIVSLEVRLTGLLTYHIKRDFSLSPTEPDYTKKRSMNEDDIDNMYYDLYSTPELAAKRFLELNK